MDVRALLEAELLGKLEDLTELDLELDTALRLDEDLLLDWIALEVELRIELTLELDIAALDLTLDATLRLDDVPMLDLAARLAAELVRTAEFVVELVLVVAGGLDTAAATVRTFKACDVSDALPARSKALMLYEYSAPGVRLVSVKL